MVTWVFLSWCLAMQSVPFQDPVEVWQSVEHARLAIQRGQLEQASQLLRSVSGPQGDALTGHMELLSGNIDYEHGALLDATAHYRASLDAFAAVGDEVRAGVAKANLELTLAGMTREKGLARRLRTMRWLCLGVAVFLLAGIASLAACLCRSAPGQG